MTSQYGGDNVWHSTKGGEVMGMANFMGNHCMCMYLISSDLITNNNDIIPSQ